MPKKQDPNGANYAWSKVAVASRNHGDGAVVATNAARAPTLSNNGPDFKAQVNSRSVIAEQQAGVAAAAHEWSSNVQQGVACPPDERLVGPDFKDQIRNVNPERNVADKAAGTEHAVPVGPTFREQEVGLETEITGARRSGPREPSSPGAYPIAQEDPFEVDVPRQHIPAGDHTRTLPAAEVIDESTLRRRIIAESEFAHAEQIDEVSEQRKRRRLQSLIVGLLMTVVLSVVLGAYFGTQNGGRGTTTANAGVTAPTVSPMPSPSPSAAPTRIIFAQQGDDINGLAGTDCDFNGYGVGGLFGTAVSLSNNGTIVAVGWGDQQEYYFRGRALGACASVYLVNIYKCLGGGSGCSRIGFIDNAYGEYSTLRSTDYISVSVSGDGSRVAVADYFVRVYSTGSLDAVGEKNSTFWDAEGDRKVVSLSNEGDLLAVLDMGDGTVVIYEYAEAEEKWQRLGQTIDGQENATEKSLDLSADGNIVAIGADLLWSAEAPCPGDEGLDYVGYNVRVFGYETGKNWTQLGSDIYGEANESLLSEQSLSLSADGKIMAIGSSTRECTYVSYATRQDMGRVRVLQFFEEEGSWVPMGSILYSEKTGDLFGVSVSLSNNGQTIAIGSSLDNGNGSNSGQTTVYRYDGTDWTQLGQDIQGKVNDRSGQSVAISGDASTVAVGAPYSAVYGERFGTARVFAMDGIQN